MGFVKHAVVVVVHSFKVSKPREGQSGCPLPRVLTSQPSLPCCCASADHGLSPSCYLHPPLRSDHSHLPTPALPLCRSVIPQLTPALPCHRCHKDLLSVLVSSSVHTTPASNPPAWAAVAKPHFPRLTVPPAFKAHTDRQEAVGEFFIDGFSSSPFRKHSAE